MEYNNVTVALLVFICGVIMILYVYKYVGNKKVTRKNVPSLDEISQILGQQVPFFQALCDDAQQRFTERVQYFLMTTKISAEKGAEVTESDKILVAASATIPLFHFDQWSYENLDEVLIYPGTFNEKYNVDATDRNILGMVGDGAMHRKMILSLRALRYGFSPEAQSNTAIHEFVHLIDKADGQIDGIPEYLIPKSLIQPWLEEMHETIRMIRNEKSDIREYATTNEAEFLAVVSEYFFQKPLQLQEDHPELFKLLDEIYNRKDK